jgi:urea transport system substrate-binding protein
MPARDSNHNAEDKSPPSGDGNAELAETLAPGSSSSGSSGKKSKVSKRDELVGTSLGKYQIVGALGRGGMGVVYQAYDALIDRQVALKLLPHEFSENEQALRRFLLEAQAAGRLNHQNTVGVYDAGIEGEIYYVVMELVTGGSVSDKLRDGPYSWKRATRIVADACQGVAAAHAAGMTHRDIKPSNLLFTEDGTVKVADFGLASAPGMMGASLSNAGDILGTPNFMSPEQCESKPVDERTDIYSLGATYFSLLTAEMPYESRATMQVMYAHIHAEPPDPWSIDPDIPAACKSIIEKAMAKSPDGRYQSVEEMLVDLNRVLTSADTVVDNHGETRIWINPEGAAPQQDAVPSQQPRSRDPDSERRSARMLEAEEENTFCGQLRRVIHESGRAADDVAADVGIPAQHLTEFLEGTRTLRSDVLERILLSVRAQVVISLRNPK